MGDHVFIYWDNSNIFHEVQRYATEGDESPGARWRVHINFDNLFNLAHANRKLVRAIAAGSVPPEMKQLWNRLESRGMEMHLFDCEDFWRGEQDMPDQVLQLQMMRDGWNNNGHPGTVVLLTGDGAGYTKGGGFHYTLEQMHERGWKIEVLSWAHTCNQRMRKWAEENGVFVALDDFYDAITFMEPSLPGHELALARDSAELDLSKRKTA